MVITITEPLNFDIHKVNPDKLITLYNLSNIRRDNKVELKLDLKNYHLLNVPSLVNDNVTNQNECYLIESKKQKGIYEILFSINWTKLLLWFLNNNCFFLQRIQSYSAQGTITLRPKLKVQEKWRKKGSQIIAIFYILMDWFVFINFIIYLYYFYRIFTICTANCKYEVLKRIATQIGMKEVSEDSGWNLCWTDATIGIDRIKDMKRFQKINHFPGMTEICRKDFLARNLKRMVKLFPKDYNFFPKTWCFPSE